MPGRAGYPEDEPRPLANLSHNALNLLEHGFYSDHEHIMAEMGQPFKFEKKSGKPIWSAHNLGLGKEENAHPELYHHMIINELEGEPVNFQEIMQERNIRDSENTPWELNEPQTFNFSGTESIPSKYTTFSTSTGYGPNMFSEIMEGRRSGGFQDIHTGEPMDLAWRLLKFQTTLPQFDPELSEETGYVGVPPVQQWHSAKLPDAMKFMTGTQDPDRHMWTIDSPERARSWGRGMTQGGPGGAVVGVRGREPKGERRVPDWVHGDSPVSLIPTEHDALTIPGAELSPQDIVMQPLPTPPPARQWEPRYSEEEIAEEKARQKSVFDRFWNLDIMDDRRDDLLDDMHARFDFDEKISDDPAFRYNPTTNAWEEDV